MARGRTFDDDARARLVELHAEGKSLNAIAKQLGFAASTISLHAAKAGLNWERKHTAVAVKAARIDRADRRGKIIDRLYGRCEKVLDRLDEEQYTYPMIVPGQGVELVTDSAPPAKDERDLSASIAQYLTQAVKLEQVDADPNEGAAAVDAWLDAMGA